MKREDGMVFYDDTQEEWLVYEPADDTTRIASLDEVDNQINAIINYLRNCKSQKIVVCDKLSKTSQAAYEIVSRFGLPMKEQKLVSLLYLCDWRHCLTNNRQITEIQWTRNMGAVPTIKNESPDLWASVIGFGMVGNQCMVKLLEKSLTVELEQSELDAIAHCYCACNKMDSLEFTRLVCSTHPFLVSNNFEDLDLVAFGKIYKLMGYWQAGVWYDAEKT